MIHCIFTYIDLDSHPSIVSHADIQNANQPYLVCVGTALEGRIRVGMHRE